MIIRPVAKTDLADCAKIMAANPLWQRYQVTEETAFERLNAGFDQNASILVAEIKGQTAGFIWYNEKGAFQRSGYVMLIGVAPSCQNQAVGDKLMDRAESQMFEAAADVFLLVSDFNIPAQRFYQRRGYLEIGSIPDYVIPGVSELIFRKQRPKATSTEGI